MNKPKKIFSKKLMNLDVDEDDDDIYNKKKALNLGDSQSTEMYIKT